MSQPRLYLTAEAGSARPRGVSADRQADASGLAAIDSETERLTGSHLDDGFTIDNLETWFATRAEHDDRPDLSIIERATGEWAGDGAAGARLEKVSPSDIELTGCRASS